jgi:hypothetical protein
MRFATPYTVVLIGLLHFALAGCSSIGHDFEIENAKKVENGMTRDQVIATMGSEPTSIEGSNQTHMTWLYSNATPFNLNMKRVRFNLNQNDVVYGIPKEGIWESPDLDDY